MFGSSLAVILSLGFIFFGVIISATGLADRESKANTNYPKHQDPEKIANQFLDKLQMGYETANIPLIISLYNDPLVAVDVTRDINIFYTASSLKAEIEQALTGLTGIKCSFTDRQITAEGDMIMIRTMRSVTANEAPIIANCLMLMILQKSVKSKESSDYIVMDQILLKEEYIQKSSG